MGCTPYGTLTRLALICHIGNIAATPKRSIRLHPQIERLTMLGTLLIILLVLMLLGSVPTWSHSRNWGYAPSGGLGLVLVILVVLVILGRI